MKKIFILIALILLTLHPTYGSTIDSLSWELAQIDSLKNPKKWIELSFDLGKKLMDLPDYPKALECYQNILLFADRQGLHADRQNATLQIARTFRRQGKHESSLKYAQQVLEELPEDSLYMRGLALRIIGLNQVLQGNYSEGYKAQMEARQIYTNLQDSALIARIEFGLGSNFFYQEQYDLALQHYQRALDICQQINLEEGISQAYKAIGSVFENQGELEKALEYNEKALEMVSPSEDARSFAWTLLNIGFFQCQMGNFKEGIQNLKKTKDLSIEMGEKRLEGYTLEMLASVAKDRGQYNQALAYLQQSYEIARATNDRSNIGALYKDFSEIYFKTKNYTKYKYYVDQYQALKDSLYNEKLIDNLSSLKQDFAIQKLAQENKIVLLEKEKELHKVELTYGIGIGIAGLVIVFLIVFMMYLRNKNQRERNQLLYRKNQEILRQNELLLSSNQDLEKYAFIISHDLKEPLRNISGFITLIKWKLKQIANPQLDEYMDFVVTNTEQIHNLLNDLLQYSKIGSKNELEFQAIDSNKLIDEVFASFKPTLAKDVKLSVQQDLPTVFYNRTHLFQIFHHLLSNSLKFCGEAPLCIEIQATENDDFYTFSVADNGIGIDPEYHEQIFVVFQRLHKRGEYAGTGIGLSMCKKIVEKHSGQISIVSELGKGATFYFKIPKKVNTNAPVEQQSNSKINLKLIPAEIENVHLEVGF